MKILKSVIVDSDGRVYIDSSLGDVSFAEEAIAPFSRCVLKDPGMSSLFEYELVPEQIISAIASGMSLEKILGIFEKFSITPLPLNVFSDLKHAEQSSDVVISGSVQKGFQVRSRNWKLLESLARDVRRAQSWDAKNGFLSVPSEDLAKLREALSGINISGVDIKCMLEENELLFRDGVPLKYVERYPGVSILDAGKRKIVIGSSFGELERIILDSRERVRGDISVVEDKIPSELRKYVRKTLDDSMRGELWNDPGLRTSKGSLLRYSFLFVKYLLGDEIERGLTSEGINYLFKVQGSGESLLPWKYVTAVCRAKGWDFVDPDEVYKSDIVKIGRVLFPERRVARHYANHYHMQEHIHSFLLSGPGVRSMDELRRDIGERILEKEECVKGIVREECHARLRDYFCKSVGLRDMSRRTSVAYYCVADSVVQGLILLVREGLLDGIVSLATKEKLSTPARIVDPDSLLRLREKRIDDERERRMRMNTIGREHVAKSLLLQKNDNSDVGASGDNIGDNICDKSGEVIEPIQKVEVPSESVKPLFVVLQPSQTLANIASVAISSSQSSSQFIQRDDRLYQRCDVVEREWQISLIDVRARMSVETLNDDARYVCVYEVFLRETSRLASLDSLIVKVERALPRRASQ